MFISMFIDKQLKKDIRYKITFLIKKNGAKYTGTPRTKDFI